jgi:hypothetical protein
MISPIVRLNDTLNDTSDCLTHGCQTLVCLRSCGRQTDLYIVVRDIDERRLSEAFETETVQILLDERDEWLAIVGVSYPFDLAFRPTDVSTVYYGSASRWRKTEITAS